MSIFGKFKDIIGMGDEFDEEFEGYENEQEEIEEEEMEPIIKTKGGNKVVNIHSQATAKVMVLKPTTFDEARDISDAIKSRKIVVVNATSLETKSAQRLVDFISGSCFVLGATIKEIEHRVYLLSPSNVQVTEELKNELSTKAIFNWNKQ
ncbi:MAG: cell division protein SepF [Clostridium sp.]